MSNELQDEEQNIDISLSNLEVDTIICPQCKNKVPASLYCVACNSPLEVSGGVSNNGNENQMEKFDVESSREIMGEKVIQINESADTRSSDNMDNSHNIEYTLTPIKTESALPVEEVFGIKFKELNDATDELDSMTSASSRKDFEFDPRIRRLAFDIFKSIYLVLWSVSLLEKGEVNEAHFLGFFRGYRERLESCTTQRDIFIKQFDVFEEFDIKTRDSRVKLEELEVRKGLGDLSNGEYEALYPALKWTINFNESERERLKNYLIKLENLSKTLPQKDINELKLMTENAEKVIEEERISYKLSHEVIDEVRLVIKMIKNLLGEQKI